MLSRSKLSRVPATTAERPTRRLAFMLLLGARVRLTQQFRQLGEVHCQRRASLRLSRLWASAIAANWRSHGEGQMTRVLFVGQQPETVDFTNPMLPPGMNAERIHAGIAVALKQMRGPVPASAR
jgi:hypothetical protein